MSSTSTPLEPNPLAEPDETYFGQIIIGPPGCGKTTYANKIDAFLRKHFGRECVVVNLDPANENVESGRCDIDICDLVQVEDVMEFKNLGPNGAMLYSMDYIAENVDWLVRRLREFKSTKYFLFDCPGQVELYSHRNSVRELVEKIKKEMNFRLCAVNLIDSHYCSDAAKFFSSLLQSLHSMCHLELPHINVLSKMDLIESESSLDFGIDFYTEVLDLSYLLDRLDSDRFSRKFHKFNKSICDVIERYSLVSFTPMDVGNEAMMYRLTKAVDKAIGYYYSEAEERKVMASGGVDAERRKEMVAGAKMEDYLGFLEKGEDVE